MICQPRPRPRRKGTAAFASDLRDLKPGDLVVHVDHGVARFAGLGRPKGGSLNRDFMMLEFAGRDRLFVPVDRCSSKLADPLSQRVVRLTTENSMPRLRAESPLK